MGEFSGGHCLSQIAVLIVDDSAVVRQVTRKILETDASIEVIGVAADPIFARQKMGQRWPDVIILDIEMPRMDGLTFLRQIMSERPTPVLICSSLADHGGETAMAALAAGAVHILTKPQTGVKDFLESKQHDLINAVKAAAKAKVKAGVKLPPPVPAQKLNADAVLPAGKPTAMAKTTERVVAIGTSTGGTQALEAILTALPDICPGIVIVQHMPEKFTALFAQRLNGLCNIEVREAQDGDRVLPGRALIAPGGKHLLLERSGAQYHVKVVNGPLVNRHRPSVDVLFRSVARSAGKNALGIIMTGMGDDGARGLKEMRDAGAHTVAQDEASCVVFGMPKEAIRLGAAQEVMPLQHIPQKILSEFTL